MRDRMDVSKINKWLEGRHRWLAVALALAALVLAAAGILVFGVFRNELGRALKPGRYTSVQMVLTQEAADPTDLPGEEEDGQADGAASSPVEMAVVKLADGIFYEKNMFDEYYAYERDGVRYALFAQPDSNPVRWTEMTAEEYNRLPSLDLSRLAELSAKDFRKTDGGYEPKGDRLKAAFAALFNIGDDNLYDYEPYSLRLTVQNGRLDEVKADFIYAGDRVVRQTLTFTYDGDKLVLPQ